MRYKYRYGCITVDNGIATTHIFKTEKECLKYVNGDKDRIFSFWESDYQHWYDLKQIRPMVIHASNCQILDYSKHIFDYKKLRL